MDLTIGITTRDRRDEVLRALRSLIPQLASGDELIVVDNGSRDDTAVAVAALLDELLPRGRLLHAPHGGVSVARNTLLAAATRGIVCFIDDDATAPPGWLEAMRTAWSRAGPRVAVIGGPIRAVWPIPRPAWIADYMLDTIGDVDRGPHRRRLTTPDVWGSNMGLRVAAAQEIGGFDPDVGPRPGAPLAREEETELEERLLAAGWEVWWDPSILVEHHVPLARLQPEYFERFWRELGRTRGGRAEFHAFESAYRLARVATRALLAWLRRDHEERINARINRAHWQAALRAAIGAPRRR